jgi:3-oxoadipate enol-lactonase
MYEVRLAASIDGPPDAPVVALGHSIGTNRGVWDRELPWLRGFRVLRFDLRGHGAPGAQSPAPHGPYTIAELATDVLATLNEHDLDQVAYCGVSLGGMVGMWLAANAPERVSRLVLCCTAAYLPPASLWTGRAATARSEGMDALTEQVVARWFTPAFARREPRAVATVAGMLKNTDPEGYAGCAEAIAAMDLRPMLPDITAPTLVISASEDPATPPWQGAEIARAIPGAGLTVVRGSSHLAVYQTPGPTGAALRAHLTAG